MKYDLILFDLDNTLICFETAQKLAFKKTMEQFSLPCSGEILQRFQKINDQLWRSFEQGKITKPEVFTYRFKMLLSPDDSHNFKEINDIFLEHLGEKPLVLEGVRDFLEQVRAQCRMGIITNGDSRVQKKKMAQLPFKDFFDFVLVSEDAGVPKPSPGIFHQAAKLAGHPERILMIGDNPRADIQGALDVGFDACWYNTDGKTIPNGIKPTYEISHFNQLIELIK